MVLSRNVILASLIAFAACIPTDSVIQKREPDTYAGNCDAAPPARSGYKAPDFPSMKSVIRAAFIDATSLAETAFGHISTIGEAHTNVAYNHYYDSEFTNAEEMWGHVFNLSLWIATGSDAQNSRWSVNFDCSGTLTGCANSPDSLAVTDANSGGTLIEICPLFWTSSSTAFLLPGNNPSNGIFSKPYRPLDGSGWCNTRQTANFFATAGHTILHELSHLDSIGKWGGLEAGPNARHGTDDFQELKTDGCQLRGARNYLDRWRQDMSDSVASPDYNAESLAGFCTENFFPTQCPNLSDIPK